MADSVIDALGASGRAQLVADRLTDLQQRAFELQLMRLANGEAGDDPVPGLPLVETYDERLDEIEAAVARLVEEYADIAPQIRRVLEHNDRVRSAQLEV